MATPAKDASVSMSCMTPSSVKRLDQNRDVSTPFEAEDLTDSRRRSRIPRPDFTKMESPAVRGEQVRYTSPTKSSAAKALPRSPRGPGFSTLLQHKEDTIVALKEAVDCDGQTIESLSKQNAELQAHQARLKQTLETSAATLANIQALYSGVKQELAGKEGELAQLRANNDALKTQLNEANAGQSAAATSTTVLGEVLSHSMLSAAELTGQLGERDALISQLTELANEKDRLVGELTLQQQHTAARLAAAAGEAATAAAALAERDTLIGSLSEMLETKDARLSALEARAESTEEALEARARSAEEALEVVRAKADALAAEYRQAVAELEAQRLAADALRAELEEVRAEGAAEAAAAAVAALREEKQLLVGQLAVSTEQLVQAEERVAELEAAARSKDVRIEELDDRVAALAAEAAALRGGAERVTALEKDLESARVERRMLQRNEQQLEDELVASRAKLDNLSAEHRKAVTELEELRGAFETAQEELEELQERQAAEAAAAEAKHAEQLQALSGRLSAAEAQHQREQMAAAKQITALQLQMGKRRSTAEAEKTAATVGTMAATLVALREQLVDAKQQLHDTTVLAENYKQEIGDLIAELQAVSGCSGRPTRSLGVDGAAAPTATTGAAESEGGTASTAYHSAGAEASSRAHSSCTGRTDVVGPAAAGAAAAGPVRLNQVVSAWLTAAILTISATQSALRGWLLR